MVALTALAVSTGAWGRGNCEFLTARSAPWVSLSWYGDPPPPSVHLTTGRREDVAAEKHACKNKTNHRGAPFQSGGPRGGGGDNQKEASDPTGVGKHIP
jgi:hypothetical protein